MKSNNLHKKNPLISIITLNFNGKIFLKDYFDSLKKQTYKNFEIIFVDNGSTDGSLEYAKKYYPYSNMIVVANKTNLAIAQGNNVGVRKAKGDYILLLNNDIKVDKNYLRELVQGFEDIPQASVLQSKVVLMDKPEILDSCGSSWTDTGFVYHYGNQKKESLPMYNRALPFFSGKSASMIIKREFIEKVGMYDDLYWGYYEETDHCHRGWIAGFETWYYPKAKVLHKFGGTTTIFDNDFKQFHNFKNKFSSFFVNFEIWYLFYLMPVFLLQNIIISFGWLVTGKHKNTLALYKAIWWTVTHFSHIMKRRKEVQKTRTLSDLEIFKRARRNPRLSYYYYLFTTDLSKYKDDPITLN
jgi:GT2 family glycosyltransferase